MKFQLVSDIHLELYKELPPLEEILIPDAPNLVLAGDICFIQHKNYVPFFEKISQLYDNIYYVFGNHEYYTKAYNGGIDGHTFDTLEETAQDMLKHLKNIFILNNKSVVIDDLVIIGTPLWCYYIFNEQRKKYVKYINNDTFMLYKNKIIPRTNMTNEIHKKQKNWLEDEINRYKGKKMILVITHYLPSLKCIPDKWKKDEDNDQFYTNLEYLVEKVNLWVCGHTHIPSVSHIDKTPIIINPKGKAGENNTYDKKCTFSIYSKL